MKKPIHRVSSKVQSTKTVHNEGSGKEWVSYGVTVSIKRPDGSWEVAWEATRSEPFEAMIEGAPEANAPEALPMAKDNVIPFNPEFIFWLESRGYKQEEWPVSVREQDRIEADAVYCKPGEKLDWNGYPSLGLGVFLKCKDCQRLAVYRGECRFCGYQPGGHI